MEIFVRNIELRNFGIGQFSHLSLHQDLNFRFTVLKLRYDPKQRIFWMRFKIWKSADTIFISRRFYFIMTFFFVIIISENCSNSFKLLHVVEIDQVQTS